MSSAKEQGPSRRKRYAVAAGAVVSGISLASGGAAMAAGNGATATAGSVTSAHFQAATVGTHVSPNKVDPAEKALKAYFKAGYDYDDAVRLAKIWHDSPYDAKILAGDKLLAGDPLPIKHHKPGDGGQTPRQIREVDAFFNAGYTYGDAVKLAKLWHTADPYHAKLRGGQKLLDGGTLPIPPHH